MKRKILTEVLSKTPEMTLYHYTTQKGLLGIVSQREIWATHTQYLNDKSEYLHALELVREEIQRRMAKVTQPEYSAILQDMRDGLVAGVEGINVCVASFSVVRDSLSQWRAYGSPTSGFAVGIPGTHLKALVQRQQFYLAECLYDTEKQQELISALVEEVFEQNCERREGNLPQEDLPPGGNLHAWLNRYAPILKSPAFAEEQEWRIISRPLMSGSERFEFREGRSMIIPYYRFPLHDTDLSFRLREIVVGPTPNPSQSVRSVSTFLLNQGVGEFAVSNSRVPYRNW